LKRTAIIVFQAVIFI